jgi:4-hydroxy-3-methylbut-2-enyl diphosphate reductase
MKGEKYAISSLEELQMLNLDGKIPILCSQTTENLVEFKKIKNFLKKLYTNAIFFDTICSVTEIRQEEAISLAKVSDGMIVIGGRNSSNTQKLYKLCHEHCDATLCIESPDEIPKDFPIGKNKIGITAGASTPGDIITEVLKLWK